MKKLLSLLLAICLCAVCFVGCDKATEGEGDGKNAIQVEDVKKDPYGAVRNASTGLTEWASDDAGIAEIFAQALVNGSIELSVESDALFSMMEAGDLDSIKATLYGDAANAKGALEVVVGMGDADMSGILYVSDGALALNSAALIGTDNTYMIKLANVLNAELFGDSILFAMMSIPEEEIANVLSGIGMIEPVLGELSAVNWNAVFTSVESAVMDTLSFNVSAGSIKDAAGKKVSCAVVSLTIDEDAIKEMLMAAIDAVTIPESIKNIITGGENVSDADLKAGLKAQLEAAIADGTIDLDVDSITMKYYVSLKTGKLVGTQAVSKTVDEEFDMTTTNTMTTLYTANGIVIEIMEDMDFYKSGIRVSLAKQDAKGVISYTLSADMVMDSMKQNVASFSAKYNKSTGALNITAGVIEGPSIELGGKVIKTETLASIGFDSLKIKNFEVQEGITTDMTVDLDFSVTAKVGATVPTIPEDAKELVTMTEEDWNELMTAFEGSLLASIIEEIMSGMGDGEDGSADIVVRKPTYIPEGMVEEEWWISDESATFGYGYPVVEDGESFVETQYRFTMFATEALYLEEIEFTREYSEGADEIKMPVGGYDVLMISVEDGLYMFWSDGMGYYSLDIWDTQFSAADIEAIITSVQ